MICDAIDLLVQIGIRHEVRRVIAISNIAKDLNNENILFEPVFQYVEGSTLAHPQWEKLGKLG